MSSNYCHAPINNCRTWTIHYYFSNYCFITCYSPYNTHTHTHIFFVTKVLTVSPDFFFFFFFVTTLNILSLSLFFLLFLSLFLFLLLWGFFNLVLYLFSFSCAKCIGFFLLLLCHPFLLNTFHPCFNFRLEISYL